MLGAVLPPHTVIPERDRRRRRRDRIRNPDLFCAEHVGIPGSVRPATRSVLPRNDEQEQRFRNDEVDYTPILSISRVLPILAATSSRTGPSFIELTGASDSAWRASK
jgi:hypothetical protein